MLGFVALRKAFVWDRKFGEPLPTLKDMMTKVEEGPEEQRPADKEVQRLIKAEAKLRERMIKLEQIFLRDARPENVKLAKQLMKLVIGLLLQYAILTWPRLIRDRGS